MMEGGVPDRQLIDAVLSGDDEAFRVLVERESRSVIGVCRRILGDAHEAEDVAQEAFLRAYQALPTYRGDGAFGAWVWRIAMRQAVARLKRRPRDLHVDPGMAEGWLEAPESSLDPANSALDRERQLEVIDAISTLPTAQREVVTLRFYSGYSLQEVAASTGAPLGTVKSRLHRALAGLREQLTPGSER